MLKNVLLSGILLTLIYIAIILTLVLSHIEVIDIKIPYTG